MKFKTGDKIRNVSDDYCSDFPIGSESVVFSCSARSVRFRDNTGDMRSRPVEDYQLVEKTIDEQIFEAEQKLESLKQKKKQQENPFPQVGQIWLNETRGEKFIVAQPTYNTYCLISLKDGGRWVDPHTDISLVFGVSKNRFKFVKRGF